MSDQRISVRPLRDDDLSVVSERVEVFGRYLREQASGRRLTIVAELDGSLAGFVSLLRLADDPVLRERGIPEISDLWVRPHARRAGVGTRLLDEIESHAAALSKVVGLNVGLHSGYGAAQRLYVRRGYMPDGRGVHIEGRTVPEGATIRLDDDPIVTLRMTRAF